MYSTQPGADMDENQQLITGHCIDNDTSANTIQICSFPA